MYKIGEIENALYCPFDVRSNSANLERVAMRMFHMLIFMPALPSMRAHRGSISYELPYSIKIHSSHHSSPSIIPNRPILLTNLMTILLKRHSAKDVAGNTLTKLRTKSKCGTYPKCITLSIFYKSHREKNLEWVLIFTWKLRLQGGSCIFWNNFLTWYSHIQNLPFKQASWLKFKV